MYDNDKFAGQSRLIMPSIQRAENHWVIRILEALPSFAYSPAHENSTLTVCSVVDEHGGML